MSIQFVCSDSDESTSTLKDCIDLNDSDSSDFALTLNGTHESINDADEVSLPKLPLDSPQSTRNCTSNNAGSIPETPWRKSDLGCWRHFKSLSSREHVCLLCRKRVKTSGNTTNAWSHLERRHKHEYQQLRDTSRSTRDITATPSTPSRKPDSGCWQHFKLLNSREHLCLLCRQRVKTSGNTTNAWSHLERRHKPEYQATKQQLVSQNRVSDDRPSIIDLILGLVILDKKPISTIENAGFGKLLDAMWPGMKVPDRSTLMDRLKLLDPKRAEEVEREQEEEEEEMGFWF